MAWLEWAGLVLCWALGPASWRAPAGWYVNGVAPSGRFEARPWLGRPEQDLEDARVRRGIADDRRLVGQLYCTDGAMPRQDGTRVWCQR